MSCAAARPPRPGAQGWVGHTHAVVWVAGVAGARHRTHPRLASQAATVCRVQELGRRTTLAMRDAHGKSVAVRVEGQGTLLWAARCSPK